MSERLSPSDGKLIIATVFIPPGTSDSSFSRERPIRPLGAREEQVFLLIADGFGSTIIAKTLGMPMETARHTVKTVKEKLGVPSLTGVILYAFATGIKEQQSDLMDNPLTNREQEVLMCLAIGLSDKAIGEKLGIRRSTAKSHRGNMLRKIGAHTHLRAVSLGLTRGFISLEEVVKPREKIPVLLSPRQKDILELVAAGATNGEIGKTLSLTKQTVAAYMQKILLRTQANSREQAVTYARESGIIL